MSAWSFELRESVEAGNSESESPTRWCKLWALCLLSSRSLVWGRLFAFQDFHWKVYLVSAPPKKENLRGKIVNRVQVLRSSLSTNSVMSIILNGKISEHVYGSIRVHLFPIALAEFVPDASIDSIFDSWLF